MECESRVGVRPSRSGISGRGGAVPGPQGAHMSDEAQLVERFATAMTERLAFNERQRRKSGWEWMTPKQLLRRAEQELGELRRAVESDANASAVAREAADVG